MTRAASLAFLVAAAAALAQSPARAGLPVAPMPREVRPDGTRDPVPPPEKAEDPAAVVERIIKNSKDVGDKLAKTDPGAETRKTQDNILKDIDALINRQEQPPPPQSGQDKNQNQDNKNDKDNKVKQNDPKNDKGDMNKQNGMPMGGMDEQPKGGRRPRMGEPNGQGQQQPDSQPDPAPKEKQGGDPKEGQASKNPTGGTPGGKAGKGEPRPMLPFEEDVAKDVWGHLPDRLRRQMSQYYKEDVMPKYSELLRLYYSSLSDKTTSPAMPRK